MLRLAFHTGFLTAYPVLEAVRIIRDHGYDAVELNAETLPWAKPHLTPKTPLATINQLAKLGPYSAICAHHADFGVADSERCRAAVDWTGRLVEIAADLDIPIVHVIPAERARLPELYDALASCVEMAQRKKIVLALEPIVGRIIGTSADALKALKTIPGLQINFDPSHLHLMGGHVPDAVRQLASAICHIHFKDATGDRDNFAFVPLGEGEIALPQMMQAIVSSGYAGVVSVEHESHIFAGDTRSVPEVLTSARAFFDRVMASLDQRRDKQVSGV